MTLALLARLKGIRSAELRRKYQNDEAQIRKKVRREDHRILYFSNPICFEEE